MLETRVCHLLEIDHPIINAPMGSAANANLAAAVSEAGGFGLIGMGRREDPSWLREQIHKARELTQRPFGVGFVSSTPRQKSLTSSERRHTWKNNENLRAKLARQLRYAVLVCHVLTSSSKLHLMNVSLP